MTVCVTEQPYTTVPMTEIYIKVEPGTGEFKIEPGQIPKIYLENPAEKGKANTELKNRLEEITSAKIGIVSGAKSRRKKLKIDISEQKFREKLEER
jgi:uncharacterized protein YggU (UPF0235/DUF167 family)